MPPIKNARGHVANEAVVYFQNSKGRLIISPHPQHPCPFGYERKVADTLSAITELSRQMGQQDHNEWGDMLEKEYVRLEPAIKAQRSRLWSYAASAGATQAQKDLIRSAVQMLDNNLVKKYRNTVYGRLAMEAHEAK